MGRKRRDTGHVIMELPTIRPLTFSSLPYDTHPIDLYDGPQGWGPFNGPWTPLDFADPAADLALYYGAGESNAWEFSPDYDVISLFADPSMDWDWNTSYDVAMENAQTEDHTSYTSTIANVVPANDNSNSMLARLRDLLQGGE